MMKIAISLTSGNKLEKPLVSAFRGNVGEYVVLDNEANGTMGLPIILVSKLINNKLSKIEDQNEWGIVKEMLRNIISGNQVDYITVADNLTGDDLFYSQLTLPVASFESLKNNYKPVGGAQIGTPAPTMTSETPSVNVMPEVSEPVNNMANVSPMGPVNTAMPIPPAPEANSVTPNTLEAAPVSPMPIPDVAPVMPSAPVAPTPMEAPVNQVNVGPIPPMAPSGEVPPVNPVVPPVAPVAPVAPVEQNIPTNPVPSVSPVEPVAPVVEPIPEKAEPIDFTADKEAFLKACENMFDALVAKFNK